VGRLKRDVVENGCDCIWRRELLNWMGDWLYLTWNLHQRALSPPESLTLGKPRKSGGDLFVKACFPFLKLHLALWFAPWCSAVRRLEAGFASCVAYLTAVNLFPTDTHSPTIASATMKKAGWS